MCGRQENLQTVSDVHRSEGLAEYAVRAPEAEFLRGVQESADAVEQGIERRNRLEQCYSIRDHLVGSVDFATCHKRMAVEKRAVP